jgi:hypothetical protein
MSLIVCRVMFSDHRKSNGHAHFRRDDCSVILHLLAVLTAGSEFQNRIGLWNLEDSLFSLAALVPGCSFEWSEKVAVIINCCFLSRNSLSHTE